MSIKTKIDYSLVIPCFNEADNLPGLLKRCDKLLKLKKFELILINNGSNDETKKIFKKLKKLKKFRNLKLIDIKKNIGFGSGVMRGLKSSRGKIIGYTHADRQTDPLDFYKCIKKIDLSKNEKLFIKGNRINKSKHGWTYFDIFLTLSQSIFQSIFLFTFMHDIHSQPNIFSKSLIKYKKSYPKDFLIDTYFYYLAKKHNYKINKLDVVFNKKFRGFGSGNNDTFLKNIKGIFQHIIGTFVLIKILMSN